MTNILFDVNIYCRFFSISKLANWVISGLLVHKGLKNQKFSHVVHLLVGLILCLVLIKIEHMAILCLLKVPKHLYLHKC